MTYKNRKHARILHFLEPLIVSHTYSLFKADLINEKATKKGFRSTVAEIEVHKSLSKSTRISEPAKNSQKRLRNQSKTTNSKFNYLPSFFQQASFTHSENGWSFLTESIFSIKSFSKRMFFLVEELRLSDLGELFLLSSCIVVRTHTIVISMVRTNIQQDDDLA